MTEGGAYSSFIRLMQIILPVTALSLLAVLFLLADAPTGAGELPFARIDISADEEQLVAPHISGVSEGGDRVQLSASRLRLLDQGSEAENLSMRIDGAQGGWITVEAGRAGLDDAGTGLRISQLARIESSTGYRVETRALTGDLDSGALQTDGPLELRAPIGQLTAGRLIVAPSGPDANHRLVFQDGVHLLYQP